MRARALAAAALLALALVALVRELGWSMSASGSGVGAGPAGPSAEVHVWAPSPVQDPAPVPAPVPAPAPPTKAPTKAPAPAPPTEVPPPPKEQPKLPPPLPPAKWDGSLDPRKSQRWQRGDPPPAPPAAVNSLPVLAHGREPPGDVPPGPEPLTLPDAVPLKGLPACPDARCEAWRGCVGAVSPPARCDAMAPSTASVRQADLLDARAKARDLLVEKLKKAVPTPQCGATLEAPGARIVNGKLEVPPELAGEVEVLSVWPRPMCGPSACSWPSRRKPGSVKAGNVAGALLVASGRRSLYLTESVAPRPKVAPPAAEGLPNIVVLGLDAVSWFAAEANAPRLVRAARESGWAMEGFHAVNEMTTMDHCRAAYAGLRSTVHKRAPFAQMSRRQVQGRWIWNWLKTRGYVTANAGNFVAGATRTPVGLARDFDVLLPSEPYSDECLGPDFALRSHIRKFADLIRASDAPVFGLTHQLQSHMKHQRVSWYADALLSGLQSLLALAEPTVVLVMGDHGNNMGVGHAYPLLAVFASSSTVDLLSQQRGYDVAAALDANRGTLTAHWDVYHTLLDLGSGGRPVEEPLPPDARAELPFAPARPTSLLRPVGDRTLDEAGVSRLSYMLSMPYAPVGRKVAPQDTAAARAAVEAMIADMNALTQRYASVCPRLAFRRITGAKKLRVGGGPLEVFQVSFRVAPSDFLYRTVLVRPDRDSPLEPGSRAPMRIEDFGAVAAFPLSAFRKHEGCAPDKKSKVLPMFCHCG